MAIKIPVFLSAPTSLSAEQSESYKFVCRCLADERLMPRALGRSDYPKDSPVMEVLLIARSCFGGVILGYSQSRMIDGVLKEGTPNEKRIADVKFPTPWNNLEAGILFSLNLPMLVFHESGIAGGVFDHGATTKYVIELPLGKLPRDKREGIIQAIKNWSAEVRTRYRTI